MWATRFGLSKGLVVGMWAALCVVHVPSTRPSTGGTVHGDGSLSFCISASFPYLHHAPKLREQPPL